MNKMELKVEELKSQGYKVIKSGFSGMNGRSYAYSILEKDGDKIRVNHQGGTKGMLSGKK